MRFISLLSLIFVFSSYGKVVSVMNYNVENLFDTIHDDGKEDYTYLPRSLKDRSPQIQKYCKSLRKKNWRKSCLFTDWNKKVLSAKLANIARVIKSYKGIGADIIILQEVENLNVVQMLVDKKLQGLGYKYVGIVEGEDIRGIDNAIISRYPIKSQKIYNFSIAPYSTRPTRGILEVDIKVGSKTLKVLANHWPSQGSPSGARFLASQKLVDIADQSNADLTLAVGDFNTLKKDYPHGVNENVLPLFYDAHLEASKLGVNLRDGSHWYKGHWSRLDRIFVLKKSKSNSKALFKTFSIYSQKFMLGSKDWVDHQTGTVTVYKDVPKRFDAKNFQGFSDHLPLVLDIVL